MRRSRSAVACKVREYLVVNERCAAIAFVERPFMGKSSAFIAFVNVDGGIMFKVFVGRDEARALRADQLERFRALAEKIAPAKAA